MSQEFVVQLDRSEYQWDTAESAASFVLRYTCSLRRFLDTGFQCNERTDQILKDLIQDLVNNGYRKTEHTRLRDYLISQLSDYIAINLQNSTTPPLVKGFDEWKKTEVSPSSLNWMRCWRDSLLERAWRALERTEHVTTDKPLYSVLHASSLNPSATISMLSVRVATTQGLKLSEKELTDLLDEARQSFAQNLADEVSETISENTVAGVSEEIQLLGLNRAFDGINLAK